MSKYSSDSNSRDRTRSYSRYYNQRHRSSSSSSTEDSRYSKKYHSSRSGSRHHKKSKRRHRSNSSSEYSSSKYKRSSRSYRRDESRSKRKHYRRSSSSSSESNHSSTSYKDNQPKSSKASHNNEKYKSSQSNSVPISQVDVSTVKSEAVRASEEPNWLQKNVYDIMKREDSIEQINQEGFVFKVFKPLSEQKEEENFQSTSLNVSKLNEEINEINNIPVNEPAFLIANQTRLLNSKYKLLTRQERCYKWAKLLFASYKQLEGRPS